MIGEGGFGVVYCGFHLGFDHSVAIQRLKIPRHFTPEARALFLEKFRDEGKTLSKLTSTHLAIVRVFDIGFTQASLGRQAPYLSLEWLDGKPLEVVLSEAKDVAVGLTPRCLSGATDSDRHPDADGGGGAPRRELQRRAWLR